MHRRSRVARWIGVILVAIAVQPAVAQQSLPIQEAIRSLMRSAAPIRGERILAAPLEGSAGGFGPTRAGTARATIHGVVENYLGDLVPLAGNVLIRSITDGRVVAAVEVDSLAQFTVRDFEPGFYTAQLVGRSGDILATTGAFTAGIGEVIRLAAVVPAAPLTNAPSLVANATQTVVSSAASAGILAVDAGTPISP